jgi:hypothetical protein
MAYGGKVHPMHIRVNIKSAWLARFLVSCGETGYKAKENPALGRAKGKGEHNARILRKSAGRLYSFAGRTTHSG